ncbi:MAG: hypothetical protein ACLU9S_14300 [Oscillospiraceae bacterium]
MVGAVAVDDGHVGQSLCQGPANGIVLLNDFDIRAEIRHLCDQIIGNASTAQEHNLPNWRGRRADFTKKQEGVPGLCHNADPVPSGQLEVAVRE